MLIKSWLTTFPEPYKSQAIKNLNLRFGEFFASSARIALANAFDWDESKEGYDYWENFCTNILKT